MSDIVPFLYVCDYSFPPVLTPVYKSFACFRNCELPPPHGNIFVQNPVAFASAQAVLTKTVALHLAVIEVFLGIVAHTKAAVRMITGFAPNPILATMNRNPYTVPMRHANQPAFVLPTKMHEIGILHISYDANGSLSFSDIDKTLCTRSASLPFRGHIAYSEVEVKCRAMSCCSSQLATSARPVVPATFYR